MRQGKKRVREEEIRKRDEEASINAFFSVSSSHLWHQIFEAGNDVGTLEFLVVTKATSYNDNSNQRDGQVQLGGEKGGKKIN